MMAEHQLAVGTDPAVKELAGKIKQARAPEIQTMQGWLASWQAPAMPGGMMGHQGHGRQQGHGGGMMSPQQMGEFQRARGDQGSLQLSGGVLSQRVSAVIDREIAGDRDVSTISGPSP